MVERWKDGAPLWNGSTLSKLEPQPEDISGDTPIISTKGLNNMPPVAGAALPEPDDADLERLGQEWNHIQAQTIEDSTRQAQPPVDLGRGIKVAVPPPSVATLQRQGSGSSSCGGNGGGLSSKRPASSGQASTSSARAKKRVFTSPYHKFCQERRPLLPAGLSNSEREKELGMAWKAHLTSEANRQPFSAAPMPLAGWEHRSSRVAWNQATLTPNATHAPAPQPQPSAPPAPQLVVRQKEPAPPHWIKLVVTDGMLRGGQVILERSGGKALCFAVPPDARPGQCIIVDLPPGVVHGQILRAHCQTPPDPYQPPPGPLLDPRLPPFPPTSLQALSPRAPELPYLPALEILTAAATHRTGVEHYLGHQQQQQLAKVMEDQLTGEEAIEIALSLGMSHPSTRLSPSAVGA